MLTSYLRYGCTASQERRNTVRDDYSARKEKMGGKNGRKVGPVEIRNSVAPCLMGREIFIRGMQ